MGDEEKHGNHFDLPLIIMSKQFLAPKGLSAKSKGLSAKSKCVQVSVM